MPQNHSKSRRAERHGDAIHREEARGRIAPEDLVQWQIGRLDARLGVGVGAAKERAKLAKKAS